MRWKFAGNAWPGRVPLSIAAVVDVLIGTFMFFTAYAGIDIDKSASSMTSMTFVGPDGWKYSRRVADPKAFDQVKVGDRVDITWSTDFTIAVE